MLVMKRKMFSAVTLTLLLTSMLILAFNIQPVKASGTIYIRADGSIDPPTAPITTGDNITYTFADNIFDEIVVERSNIIIDGYRYTLQGIGTGNGFYLSGIDNVTIKNTTIKNYQYGIMLYSSSNNTISRNNITANNSEGIYLEGYSDYNRIAGNSINNSQYGIRLYYSSDNSIVGNNITNNEYGIRLTYSTYNNISENNVTANSRDGIYLYESSNNIISKNSITANNGDGIYFYASCYNNTIYHNNLINNTNQVDISYTSGNVWDDGYPSGGNYWSDYTGVDANGDGIGDTPYIIDANNTDRYPLMHPWSPLPVHNINTGLGYATIQEAIDAPETLDRHTIFVEAGTYFEHVRIERKSLALIGESKENTIIDGNGTGTVVTLWYAPNVTISGFTIRNSGVGYDLSSGIYLYISPYSNITGNIVRNNQNGIKLSYSHDTFLVGNIVSSSMSGGVVLDFSAGSTLKNNEMSGNHYNFVVESAGYLSEWIYDIDTSNTVDGKPVYYLINQHDTHVPTNAGYIAAINSTRIMVKNVTLTNNGQGVFFFYTTNSTIENATIINNEHGIVLSYSWNITIMQNKVTNSGGEGIELIVSHYNTIENNDILDNGLKGIAMFWGSTHNNITYNVIANNAGGVSIEGGSNNNVVENIITNSSGVFIMGSSNNIIKNTIINNNVGNGIFMWPGSDTNIRGNIIMNSEYGIYLGGGSQNNKIYENSIINNKFGIYMAHINNTVYHNNFVNNEKQAYNHYLGFKNVWDDGYPSGGNYWGDYTGVDINNDGLGDTPYVIDENNTDRHPLMAPFRTFNIGAWNGTSYNVGMVTNSTVSSFQVDTDKKRISFNVSGVEGTIGFCRVAIPNIIVQDLWQGNYTVLLDGSPWSFINWTDNVNTYILINYTHSEHEVVIIPEFPSTLTLAIFMLTTSIATTLWKTKRKRQPP
jgi:parallel beta-helix repeat protein